MTLLGGQTSESLSGVWEIASFIDVAYENFSWVVEAPLLKPHRYFYGLKFSLEGSEGIFSISPPFTIVSRDDDSMNCDNADMNVKHIERRVEGGNDGGDSADDDNPDKVNDDPSEAGNGVDTPNDDNKSSTQDRPQSSLPSPKVTSTTTTPVIVPADADENVTSQSNSKLSSNTATPAPNLISDPRISKGGIAGIVVGATVFLVVFTSLIGLVWYYRRRLLGKAKSSSSDENRNSKVDGRFIKAELDVEGSQIAITRVYELDSTGEIREADGNMKPAELGSTVPRRDLHAADVRNDSIGTEDSDSLVLRAKV
ncbi:hypothetical protein F4859DRAFT_512318 [Xylaria cf. heliscus]|nr:hypothetical protein F4859DRAFT_512318 [Xylaria cf. heliscus]